MKKYVDLSPLYMDVSKDINEEQVKIKGWRKWLVFFIVMSVLSILPTFFFSFRELLLMYVVIICSLFGIFVSLDFIKMYKRFIKKWEELEIEANDGWKEVEDRHNEDWNKWFEDVRNSGNFTEEFVKNNEQDIIDRSKKNIESMLNDRE